MSIEEKPKLTEEQIKEIVEEYLKQQKAKKEEDARKAESIKEYVSNFIKSLLKNFPTSLVAIILKNWLDSGNRFEDLVKWLSELIDSFFK